jgi:hypothetical protein
LDGATLDAAVEPRALRVFLASAGDLTEERDALARLVRDINDVLAYLAPESRLSLELIRYETHSYPDIGQAQEVINRQIPIDYDIFIGAMWRRCGTRTATSPSGTIEEFRRACEKRSHGGHLPRIMFYFCEQLIPIPDVTELEQLQEVVKFRDELAKIGLTSTYPSHAEFAEHVRGGLLRAIRDILQEESRVQTTTAATEHPPMVDSSDQSEMLALAAEYEEIRRKEQAGGSRTRHMTAVFSRMKAKAAAVRGLLDEFRNSPSPGIRLAAIAVLQMFPDIHYVDWLSERLDNPSLEKPFIGYHAAIALLEAVRALPTTECEPLKAALAKAKSLAKKLPTDPDRLHVLATAEEELSRRCSGS